MAYIIAEAGVNHNGRMDLAVELIVAAKRCRANAVKFQLFDAEKLEPPGKRRDMLAKLQLSKEQIHELKCEAEKQGLDFLCTPFDLESLIFLSRIDCKSVKIGSADFENFQLVEEALRRFDLILLSTGMASIDAIRRLIGWRPHSAGFLVLMHCTSSYPCPLQDMNLKVMSDAYFKGFSDHSLSTVVPAAAVALGAEYIEKHLTLDNRMEGPDHHMSLEPREFAEMVQNIREVELALGDGVKRVMPSELPVMKVRDEREKWRMSS